MRCAIIQRNSQIRDKKLIFFIRRTYTSFPLRLLCYNTYTLAFLPNFFAWILSKELWTNFNNTFTLLTSYCYASTHHLIDYLSRYLQKAFTLPVQVIVFIPPCTQCILINLYGICLFVGNKDYYIKHILIVDRT